MTHRTPMEIRKSKIKWLVWMLAFFLATAGLAQGAERCRGKCCQGPQETAVQEQPAVHEPGVPELPLNPNTPLDAFLPSCHLPGPLVGHQRAAVSEEAPCQDESTPSCCHMGKVRDRVQALASQGHSFGPDRLSHAVMVVCIQPDAFLTEDRFAVDGWTLHPSAAPVPLYLKNASFIC